MSIAQARLTRESQSKKLRHTVTVRGHVIGFLRFNNESDSILATVGNNSTSVFMWLMRFGFFYIGRTPANFCFQALFCFVFFKGKLDLAYILFPQTEVQ